MKYLMKEHISALKFIHIAICIASLFYFLFCWHQTSLRQIGTFSSVDVTPSGFLPPLGGDLAIKYSFPFKGDKIGRVYLFSNKASISANLDQELIIVLREKGTISPVLKKTVLLKKDEVFRESWIQLDFEPLLLAPGKVYEMQLSMPGVSTGKGLSLQWNRPFRENDSGLLLNKTGHKDKALSLVIMPDKPIKPYLAGYIGLLLVLLLLVFTFRSRCTIPFLFMVLSGMTLMLSEYIWERLVWGFWGHYWPDGYVQTAYQFTLWFNNTHTYQDFFNYLAHFRNGQSWFVPFLISIFNTIGFDYLHAYMLINTGFTFGALYLLFNYATRQNVFRDKLIQCFLLIGLFWQVLIFRAIFPVTDAGGLFFTALFTVTYINVLSSKKRALTDLILPTFAIFLGCQTRIALLPLLFVPPSMAIWFFVFRKERHFKHLLWLTLPTLLGGGLLVIVYTSANLWHTIILAKQFSALPEFRNLFSWKGFFISTLLGTQLVLFIIPWNLKRLISQELDALLICIILGFEGMMLVGKIIPWPRYWILMAPLAAYYSFFILKLNIKNRWLYCAIVFFVGFLNLCYAVRNPIM